MRSSVSFGGSQVMGEPTFPSDFFAALADGEENGAFASVRREAILPDGQPSPRVVELGGEWDTSVVVSLCLLDEGCCAGSVGGEERFCGKPWSTCNIDKHKKTVKEVRRGWYIAAGSRLTGYYWSPCLPTEEDGGPITAGGAAFLNEADPFRMSRGQWILVMDAWHAQQARAAPGASGGVEESKDAAADTPSTLGMGDAADPLTVFRANLPPIDTGGGRATGLNNWPDAGEAPNASSLAVDPFDDPFNAWQENPILAAETRPTEEQRTAFQSPTPTAAAAAVERLERRLDEHQREAGHEKRRLDNYVHELGQVKRGVDMLAKAFDQQMEAQLTEIQAVGQRVKDLKGKEQAFTAAGWVGTIRRMSDALFSSQGVVPMLGLQLRNLKDHIDSGGGIECNGVRFASMREALAWYDAKAISTPGLFVDAMALLHGVASPFCSMAVAGKQLEEIVVQSFRTTIPQCFVGGKLEVEGAGIHTILRSAIKSFQVWKPRGELSTGLSTQIVDGILELTDQLRAFRNKHTEDPTVRELAAGILADSLHFCRELVNFINTQNESLTHDTTYSAEQIWEMQLECLRTIFQELSVARRETRLAAKHKQGYYLWGMLKAWVIQQRYLKNHFKDDPALTGIFVRRVVMQSGQDGIKDKLAKLDKLADQVVENHRAHTQAIKALQTALAKLKPV
jgi:uncharacterized protein YneF (UPF0154 family)